MTCATSTHANCRRWVKVLRVDCPRCDRHGRYLVDKLIYDHGPEAKLIEWFSKLTQTVRRRTKAGLAML
jgi:hypothetical protein